MKVKKNIRKRLLQARNNLNKNLVTNLSQQICDKILTHPYFVNSKTVATYHAIGNEVELFSLFNSNKEIALPVIQAKHIMQFRAVESQSHLTTNQYGILEPLDGQIINHEKIDLCILPMTGFSCRGDRLGMGGGYYDRYFELNKFQKKPTILAGVAYDFQEDDTIKSDAWDIPLDLIFTNKHIIEL
ncbi:MAG: 5-formyltetrahydrofolate cyclo-ligase [Alcanivoracaceae bacterium]|nr:5-formyltetrahydrofolate cyclo-ligase [Alcanivoracaceae bacterium]